MQTATPVRLLPRGSVGHQRSFVAFTEECGMPTMRVAAICASAMLLLSAVSRGEAAAEDLERGFAQPPDSAKPWAYWWWLDSNASKEGITRDLE